MTLDDIQLALVPVSEKSASVYKSYVVTDPKGTILVECGKMLQRGAPKLGKDGKPMKDKHGKAVLTDEQAARLLDAIQ